MLCWQAYTTLAEAVWAVVVEYSNNRQVLFFYTIDALHLWRPSILPLPYWLSLKETTWLVLPYYYARNWQKWWYCTTTNSAIRSLLYRVQSANLKFSWLGMDSVGFGHLGQFVVANWWFNIWWYTLVVHFGGAFWWCILVVHICCVFEAF